MQQSLSFAAKIQTQFKNNSKRFVRGVKQAGFLVLYKTAMPSVLIENGFLTNENDQRFLISDAGQASIASSIYRAFKSYKSELETGIVNNDKNEEQEDAAEEKTDTNKSTQSIIVDNALKNPKEEKREIEENSTIKEIDTTKASKSDRNEVANPKEKTDKLKLNPTPKTNAPKTITKPNIDYSNLEFITVQVGAVKDGGAMPEKINELKTVFNITFEDGYTRYFVGKYSTITDAKARLEKLKDAGFNDAFLTAYDHMVKVKPSEIQNKK
jgi:N-acetylmuramoyl-L-alanine amidase